jgi:multidrug resistance efflux pump
MPSSEASAPLGQRRYSSSRCILLIVGGLIYWLATRNEVSTDDAFVDGRAASVGPRVAGAVVSLDVNDNQFVHAGDPLVHLDPRPFKLALDQAQADLETARAQLAAQTPWTAGFTAQFSGAIGAGAGAVAQRSCGVGKGAERRAA